MYIYIGGDRGEARCSSAAGAAAGDTKRGLVERDTLAAQPTGAQDSGRTTL